MQLKVKSSRESHTSTIHYYIYQRRVLKFQLGFSILLYSKKAIDQLNIITPIKGKEANQPDSCFNFK